MNLGLAPHYFGLYLRPGHFELVVKLLRARVQLFECLCEPVNWLGCTTTVVV